MSYYLKVIGTRKNVRARIKAEPYIPASIKTALIETIMAGQKDGVESKTGVSVEVIGHYDPANEASSITRMVVETLEIAPTAPPDETEGTTQEPAKELANTAAPAAAAESAGEGTGA